MYALRTAIELNVVDLPVARRLAVRTALFTDGFKRLLNAVFLWQFTDCFQGTSDKIKVRGGHLAV
jgi:hypothetical protein